MFSLEKSVVSILKNSDGPIMAKDIAKKIRKDHGHNISRRDVNSVLYNELEGKVEKNSDHAWIIL